MSIKENKNIEHLMTVICNSSSVDIDSNSLSLFNLIDEINISDEKPIDLIQKKPIQFYFEIVSIWKRFNIDVDVIEDLKIVLLDPKNDVMQEIVCKLEIKNTHKRMRLRIKETVLNVTNSGEYYFSVLLKKGNSFEEITRVPFLVKITSPVPSDLRILKK